MAYSTSRKTLDKMLEHLEPMLQNPQGCTWVSNRPHAFAYKLREALYIAGLYWEDYPRVAKLADRFAITVRLPDQIMAIPKEAAGPVLRVENGGDSGEPLDTRNELIQVKGMQTVSMVMESWMAGNAKKMTFPDARLRKDELQALYRWAQKRQLLFFHSHETGLTLQAYDEELAPFAWTPEDEL